MSQAKKLLVMAGGTGGHVFPGLAVAHYLQAQGWKSCWLGTADRMEATLVPKHGIDIEFIQISGLRGKGIAAQLGAPWRIYKAPPSKNNYQALSARCCIRHGGYVSGPGVRHGNVVYPLCFMNKMVLQVNE